MSSTPSTPSATTIAQMLQSRQAAMGAPDQAIANALGYPNAAAITMIREGRMRLPLNKAAAFASALDIEPATVMRALLKEMDPAILDAIEQCLAPLSLSPGETRLIAALRKQAAGRDIAPISFDKDAIVALVVAR